MKTTKWVDNESSSWKRDGTVYGHVGIMASTPKVAFLKWIAYAVTYTDGCKQLGIKYPHQTQKYRTRYQAKKAAERYMQELQKWGKICTK